MTKEIETIPCSLRPMPEFTSVSCKNDSVRYGRYSKGIYQIQGYGKEKWAFSCYVVLEVADIAHYLAKGMTLKEIGLGCMKYLNRPPERKMFEKAEKNSLYGNLTDVVVCTPMPNGKILSAVFITDQQNNKYLWGSGIKRKRVE